MLNRFLFLQIDQLRRSNRELTDENAALRRQATQQTKESQELSTANRELNAAIQRLTDEVRRLTTTNQELARTSQAVNAANQQLTTTNRDLTAQLAELQAQAEDGAALSSAMQVGKILQSIFQLQWENLSKYYCDWPVFWKILWGLLFHALPSSAFSVGDGQLQNPLHTTITFYQVAWRVWLAAIPEENLKKYHILSVCGSLFSITHFSLQPSLKWSSFFSLSWLKLNHFFLLYRW